MSTPPRVLLATWAGVFQRPQAPTIEVSKQLAHAARSGLGGAGQLKAPTGPASRHHSQAQHGFSGLLWLLWTAAINLERCRPLLHASLRIHCCTVHHTAGGDFGRSSSRGAPSISPGDWAAGQMHVGLALILPAAGRAARGLSLCALARSLLHWQCWSALVIQA